MIERQFKGAHSGRQDHCLEFAILPSGDNDSRHLSTHANKRFSIAAPLPIVDPLASSIFLRRCPPALLRERNCGVE